MSPLQKATQVCGRKRSACRVREVRRHILRKLESLRRGFVEPPPRKLGGDGGSERFDPTGADESYQFAYPGDWPYWGSGHDLHMGGGRALGTDGYCLQGTTYAGTPNQICGCNAYENNGCWGPADWSCDPAGGPATQLVVLGR